MNKNDENVTVLFSHKHPNILKSIITVFIILFISAATSLVGYEASSNTIYSEKVEKDAITSAHSGGYDISNGVYTPVNDDPQIYLSLPSLLNGVNCVKIYGEKISDFKYVQIYYSKNGEPLSEANSKTGYISNDKSFLIVMLPDTDIDLVRLDIGARFTPSHVEFMKVEPAVAKKTLNLTALIALITLTAVAAAAAVFEKRIGAYALIGTVFKKQYEYICHCIRDRKFIPITARLLALLSGCVLVGSLLIFFMLSSYSPKLSVYIFVAAVVFVAAFIFDRFLSDKGNGAFVFLVLTLAIGLAFVFCQPPNIGGGWDEEIHYDRALSLKNTIFGGSSTIADRYLINYTESFHAYFDYGNAVGIYGDAHLNNLVYADSIHVNSGSNTISIYSSLSYLPAAFTMRLFELLNADILTRVVMPKIANLLVYVTVLYLGMRRLRRGVLIFSSIAMLPTAIFISTLYTYDFIITAFAGYSFMYLISILSDGEKKITFRDAAHILGSIFIGCSAKAIYFILATPLLFIKKDKFASPEVRRRILIAAGGVMLFILLTFALPFVINIEGYSDHRGGEGISAAGQVMFILTNPLKYAKILISFLSDYISFPITVPSSVGIAYFGEGRYFLGSLSVAAILITVLLDRDESDDLNVGYKIKGLFALVAAVDLVLIATALYVSFNPVGNPGIGGCQPRYMIPLLFSACYAIGPSRIKNNINKKIFSTVIFSAVSLAALLTLYQTVITMFNM